MSDTVTIYCCGTRYSRENKATKSVAFTWDKTTSRKFILDGPGSPTSKTPISGGVDNQNIGRILKTENIMKRLEKGKGVSDKKFLDYYSYKKKKDGTPTIWSKGALKGVGSADNIIMAVQWLWEQFYVGKESSHTSFSTINLVGFSRGAVTCIMLAHAIDEAGFKKKNPKMKVNVFVFDPVPGGLNDFKVKGTFDSTGRVGSPKLLPEVVSEYKSVLMENVGSGLFKCVSPKEFKSAGQSITEYPLPGDHGDSVDFRNHSSGKIAIHLCHDFLTRNNTKLSATKNLTDFQLLEEYAKMRLKVLKEGVTIRQVATKRENLIVNLKRKDLFYINGHHCELFRATLPKLVTLLNTKIPVTDKIVLQHLRVRLPTTSKVLKKLGRI